jgi:hypothetical protein
MASRQMGTHRVWLRVVLALTCLVMLGGRALAGNTGKFGEKWADKLVKFSEDGDKWLEKSSTGTFTFSKTFFIDNPIDPADLGPETVVFISIGGWEFSSTLGDSDKGFLPGQTVAKFTLTHEVWKWNDKKQEETVKIVKHGTVSIKFTKKGAVVSISAKTGWDRKKDADQEVSPLASSYEATNGPVDDQMTVSIEIVNEPEEDTLATVGYWYTDHVFNITGKATVKTVVKSE